MSNQKPSLPKGTRDFGPEQMAKRNYIFEPIKEVFRKYGFEQLETPAMENLSVLTGKYGEEGDQLLYRILNSGDFLSKTTADDYHAGSKELTKKITDRGLRYDLTVPFARFVVMNRNDIAFPFKRYQIQPVWRADRPQKGRYREFFQCDADVVGTDSLICEAEIVMMINEVFEKLGINDYNIIINNRKVLTGITEVIGAEGKETDFCVAVDKLDKIGEGKVLDELRQRGFSEDSIEKLIPFLSIQGSNEEQLARMKDIFKDSETGRKGIEELEQVFEYVKAFGLENNHLKFDLTLARGLSYYTGAIFEVKVNNVKIGSVSGGGRYDNLTEAFGMPDMSGVGFSFGVDRIYDVMEELKLFPEEVSQSSQVMIANFDPHSEIYGLGVLNKLRKAGIRAELYPDGVKLKKQLNYANKKNIPYVIMLGSEEIKSGQLTLKNMVDGTQDQLTVEGIIQKIYS